MNQNIKMYVDKLNIKLSQDSYYLLENNKYISDDINSIILEYYDVMVKNSKQKMFDSKKLNNDIIVKILCIYKGNDNYYDDIFNCTYDHMYEKIEELDILCKNILLLLNSNDVFTSLHEIWYNLKNKMMIDKHCPENIEILLSNSIFSNTSLEVNITNKPIENPTVSVVIPVLNGEKFILDAINSILNQTYRDFEILIILDMRTNDRTEKFLKLFKDRRIKIIKNKNLNNLANSLNYGISIAKGKYIARLDADDYSDFNRLEKQINFFDNNKEISLCGTWQKHYSKDSVFVHKAATSHEDICAVLMFKCDVCHSTVMFKKDDFINNSLYYNPLYSMEDYELWLRATKILRFACIPEILGDYRHSDENITASKFDKVQLCEIELVSNNIRQLHIDVDKYDRKLFQNWINPYYENPTLKKMNIRLLGEIKEKNNIYKTYDSESLNKVIENRIKWMNDAISIKKSNVQIVKSKAKRVLLRLKKILRKG